jgi:hypothetical protein
MHDYFNSVGTSKQRPKHRLLEHGCGALSHPGKTETGKVICLSHNRNYVNVATIQPESTSNQDSIQATVSLQGSISTVQKKPSFRKPYHK